MFEVEVTVCLEDMIVCPSCLYESWLARLACLLGDDGG
jgi:hypothetical protein